MLKYTHKIFLGIGLIFLISACASWHQSSSPNLPPISKPSYLDLSVSNEDSFSVSMKNQLPVDRYVILRSSIDSIAAKLDAYNPFILPSGDSLSVSLMAETDSTTYSEIAKSLQGSSFIGNPVTAQPDTTHGYLLPVGKGKSYRILQGQDGTFSHTRPDNRYSIDFAMSVGDTIYAARSGVVAYLFEQSVHGGNHPDYLPYSNTLIILHGDGTVAQYSHLRAQGVLVEIGDEVLGGEPVALSGNTGFVSGDHLHFNVMKPTYSNPLSIPVTFRGFEGKRFKKGDVVSHY